MKTFKQVHVPTRDVRYFETVYDLRPRNLEVNYRRGSANVSCQCNILHPLCTCKKLASSEQRYFSTHKQVYRYTDWHNFADIGVSSIKVLPRKKIWKIYLPETIDQAVGSADWTSGIKRRSKDRGTVNHYENKRTYSKCVGGFVDKKLSPILQKKSGTTSPISRILGDQDNSNEISNLEQPKSPISVRINVNELNTKLKAKENYEISEIKSENTSKLTLQDKMKKDGLSTATEKLKSVVTFDNAEICKVNSSDSFVQHIHNLENPSDDKQTKLLAKLKANNLATEYRKIFKSNSKETRHVEKPMSDLKTTYLRKRFEALRRGMGKKESNKESIITNKTASQIGVPSCKDVSIASDPPSLESRSFSNTKIYSPNQSARNYYKPQGNISPKRSPEKRPKEKNNKDCSRRSSELEIDSNNYESVQGMFKLWAQKFNLDEDSYKTSPSDVTRSPDELSKSESPPQADFLKKKQCRKFFIFGKKTTDKENKSYKSKKGVTAGRCEVKDGLSIKVEVGNECPMTEPDKKQEKQLDNYDNILHKSWLHKFISNKKDSRNSVHIRWNNKMYATSSSTVLELMDNVYKQTGINFRSRSEITTGVSSNYNAYSKQRQHFMHKDIEAWMIPKMITNMHQRQSTDHKAYYDSNTCQRWFVDASKGFSHKIELVLHSKTNGRDSEYVIINIPEGYFSHSSSDLRAQSSDEKIFNVVEYDTPELKRVKEKRHMATGDYFINDSILNGDAKQDEGSTISETDSEDKEMPTLFRDVAIQGSDVILPQRCDVIEVGIITQKDIRDGKRSVLKIEDKLSGDDSEVSISQKKCDLADSYLQNYCRNWMPSGIDTLTWRLSDCQHTEKNSLASLSQGDGSKSQANMCENLQDSNIVSSPCSQCFCLEDDKKPDDTLTRKFLNKFKKKPTEIPLCCDNRNYPKDSLEVYKRRQYYARKNIKTQWYKGEIESNSCPNKKQAKKRVSLPDFDDTSELVDQLTDDCPTLSSHASIETLKEHLCSECFKGARKMSSESCNHLVAKKTSQESDLSHHMSPTTSSSATDTSFSINSNNSKRTKECKATCANKNEDFKKFVKPPPKPPIACHIPQKTDLTNNDKDTKECKTKCARKKENFKEIVCTPQSPPSRACHIPQTPDSTNNDKDTKECKTKCARKKENFKEIVCTPPSPPPTACHIPQTIDSTHNGKDTKECKTKCARKKENFEKLVNTPPTPPPTACHIPQTLDSTHNGKDTKECKTKCARKKENFKEIVCTPQSPPPTACHIPQTIDSTHNGKDTKECKTKCARKKENFEKLVNTPPTPPPTAYHMPLTPDSTNNYKDTKECQSKCARKMENLKKNVNTPLTPPPTAYHMPQTPDSTNNSKDTKECQSKCTRKKENCKEIANTPPTLSPTAKHMPQTTNSTNNSKGKATGLHLKKIPPPKISASNSSFDCDGPCVIRLNSQEEFTVRVKKNTPSTEEIRESLNIKVRDEDGQTLYERIDYKQSEDLNDPTIKYVNKNSQIQRVSTPTTVQDLIEHRESQNEIGDVRSESSIDNLIEINFTLKLKQGDKATEITVKNDSDTEIKQRNDGKVAQSNSIIIQNAAEQEPVGTSKKDIHIKIIIKNYNTDSEKTNENEMYAVHNNAESDAFAKGISEKFQTVATGYSDIDQNVVSIHRATVDLTASVDEYRVESKLSQYIASDEIVKIPHSLITSYNSGKECPVTDQIVSSMYTDEEVSAASMKKSYTDYVRTTILSQKETDNFDNKNTNKNTSIKSQKHIVEAADKTSNESVLFKNIRLHKRTEKKAMLKKLFRSSSIVKKPENKKKIKDLLHAILTSDSSGTEKSVTTNELAKKITYDSLDPSYITNEDSTNGYSHLESDYNCNENYRQKILNPTRNNSELTEYDSDISSTDDKKQGCLCSLLATKLNIALNGGLSKCGCCCQGKGKKNEEYNYEVGTDHFLFHVKTSMDVETQSSKHVLRKLNNTKLGKQSKIPSVVITNTVTVDNSINEHIAAKHESSKTYLPNSDDAKYFGTKTFNKETIIGLSDDILLFKSNVVKKSVSVSKRQKIYRNANSKQADIDILQLNETKKAVLEIYKEKITSDKGEILIAKLPKFNIEKKTITNYEGVLSGAKKVSKRNYVMMAVTR